MDDDLIRIVVEVGLRADRDQLFVLIKQEELIASHTLLSVVQSGEIQLGCLQKLAKIGWSLHSFGLTSIGDLDRGLPYH